MRVRIELEPGENELEANELLVKALQTQAQGEAHKEAFQDEGTQLIVDKMLEAHKNIFDELLTELDSILK